MCNTLRRLAALVSVPLVVVPVCAGAQETAAPRLSLTEVHPGAPPRPAPPARLAARPLARSDVDTILKRLPPIEHHEGDRSPFVLSKSTPPSPRSQHVVRSNLQTTPTRPRPRSAWTHAPKAEAFNSLY